MPLVAREQSWTEGRPEQLWMLESPWETAQAGEEKNHQIGQSGQCSGTKSSSNI